MYTKIQKRPKLKLLSFLTCWCVLASILTPLAQASPADEHPGAWETVFAQYDQAITFDRELLDRDDTLYYGDIVGKSISVRHYPFNPQPVERLVLEVTFTFKRYAHCSSDDPDAVCVQGFTVGLDQSSLDDRDIYVMTPDGVALPVELLSATELVEGKDFDPEPDFFYEGYTAQYGVVAPEGGWQAVDEDDPASQPIYEVYLREGEVIDGAGSPLQGGLLSELYFKTEYVAPFDGRVEAVATGDSVSLTGTVKVNKPGYVVTGWEEPQMELFKFTLTPVIEKTGEVDDPDFEPYEVSETFAFSNLAGGHYQVWLNLPDGQSSWGQFTVQTELSAALLAFPFILDKSLEQPLQIVLQLRQGDQVDFTTLDENDLVIEGDNGFVGYPRFGGILEAGSPWELFYGEAPFPYQVVPAGLDSEWLLDADSGFGQGDAAEGGDDLFEPIAPEDTYYYAVYEIAAPDGTWDSRDNGLYAFSLNRDEIAWEDGESLPGGLLGWFRVDILLDEPWIDPGEGDDPSVDPNPNTGDGQIPFRPRLETFSVSTADAAGNLVLELAFEIPNLTDKIDDWGVAKLQDNGIFVIDMALSASEVSLPAVYTESHQYELGQMPEGEYFVEFHASGIPFERIKFAVDSSGKPGDVEGPGDEPTEPGDKPSKGDGDDTGNTGGDGRDDGNSGNDDQGGTGEDAEGWVNFSGLGYMKPAEGTNWMYHTSLEWIYAEDDNADITDGSWFWRQNLGWFWTDAATWPFIYAADSGEWLWHDTGSAEPNWYYNLSTGGWEEH